MRKIVISSLLIVLCSTSLGFAGVEFKQAVKQSVKGMKIYEVVLEQMDFDSRLVRINQVLSTAGKESGAQEKNIVRTDRFVGFNNDSLETIINKYGSEIIFTDLKGLKLTEATGKLPSNNESVNIAKNFLDKANLVDMKKDELVIGHIGGLMQALATPERSYAPQQKAVTVHFNRVLDGYPVMNKGSHISVMIGDNYAPVNLCYSWREIKMAIKNVESPEAVATEEVHKLIEEDLSNVFDMEKNIVITKIYPVYYDNGLKYIQPAYCYEGTVATKEGTEPVLGYVAGLRNPPEEVHHPAYLNDLTFPIKTKP
jgi:hypothetical protein